MQLSLFFCWGIKNNLCDEHTNLWQEKGCLGSYAISAALPLLSKEVNVDRSRLCVCLQFTINQAKQLFLKSIQFQ